MSIPTPTCPDWCEGGHRADYPVHRREIGDVEINGTEVGVSLFQNDDKPPQVVMYVHDKEETRAIHMAAEDADALRAHIRIATDHLLGDHYR